MTLDWTNAEAVDGRMFAEWLTDHGVSFDRRTEKNWYRMHCEWRRGRNPKIETVDAILVSRFYHLSELPDDIWTVPRRPGRVRYSDEVKAEVLANIENGANAASEARRLGISDKTVQWWARESKVVSITRIRREKARKKARQMMEQGARQIEIHRETGVALSTLDRWRGKAAA